MPLSFSKEAMMESLESAKARHMPSMSGNLSENYYSKKLENNNFFAGTTNFSVQWMCSRGSCFWFFMLIWLWIIPAPEVGKTTYCMQPIREPANSTLRYISERCQHINKWSHLCLSALWAVSRSGSLGIVAFHLEITVVTSTLPIFLSQQERKRGEGVLKNS